jgi:DNA-directed RNA polymerase specialized sigma24 family protein
MEAVVYSCARKEGLPDVDAEECAMEFLSKMLIQEGMAGIAALTASPEKLQQRAQAFARRWAFRRRRKCRREVSYEEIEKAERDGARGALVSPEPGPETLVMVADLMDEILAALSELAPDRQSLFVRCCLEDRRLVDLQEETGRSADALWHALVLIRKRLQKVLEGRGLSAAEIAEYRNMLDRRNDLR